MSFNLLQALEEQFSSHDTTVVAETLDMDAKNLEADRPIICAAVLAGLMKKCTTERGVVSLGSMVDAVQPQTSDADPEVEPPTKSIDDLVEEGHTALDRIFGSGLNDLIGAFSSYCKSNRYQLAKLFSVAGSSTLHKLHEIKGSKRLEDNEDLATLILSQAAIVRDSLPDNLYAALGLRNLGSYATNLLDERKESVEKIMNKPQKSGIEELLVRKLLPVGGVVIILIVMWTLFRGCS